jgi:hypothetical protein
MAKYLKRAEGIAVSHNFIAQVWRDHDLQPQRLVTFKLSNDPEFEAKVADVVGLYLDPPVGAVVLSIDGSGWRSDASWRRAWGAVPPRPPAGGRAAADASTWRGAGPSLVRRELCRSRPAAVDTAQETDAVEPLHVEIVIEAMSGRGAPRRDEKPDLVVVAQRSDRQPGCPRQLADLDPATAVAHECDGKG